MKNHTIQIKDEKLLKVGEYKVVGRKVVFLTRDFWGMCFMWKGIPLGWLSANVFINLIGLKISLLKTISDIFMLAWLFYVLFGMIKRTEIVGTLKEIKNG